MLCVASWAKMSSDRRRIQNILIEVKRSISITKVTANVATVRNASATGTGVMERLARSESRILRRALVVSVFFTPALDVPLD